MSTQLFPAKMTAVKKVSLGKHTRGADMKLKNLFVQATFNRSCYLMSVHSIGNLWINVCCDYSGTRTVTFNVTVRLVSTVT